MLIQLCQHFFFNMRFHYDKMAHTIILNMTKWHIKIGEISRQFYFVKLIYLAAFGKATSTPIAKTLQTNAIQVKIPPLKETTYKTAPAA